MNMQYDKANMFDVLHHKKVINFVQGARKNYIAFEFLFSIQCFCVGDFYSLQLRFR